MEKARMKSYLCLITFTALLLTVVLNFSDAVLLLGKLWHEFYPVVLACLIAFVINVPMSAISRRLNVLFARKKHKPSDMAISGVSLLITILILTLVLALVSTIIFPQLAQSVHSIYDLIRQKLPEWSAYLESLDLDPSLLQEYFQQQDLNALLQKFTSNAGSVLNTIIGTASFTIGAFITFILAFIIAIYIVLNKRALTRQAKALAYANLKRQHADRLCYIASLLNRTYSKFLSGQCIEAVILGLLLFLVLGLAGIPYAGIIAFSTAIMSFVPYIGAFLSCLLGVLLILMVDPFKALLCFVLFECVQFVEGHFIYPKVVGNSVGLPSLWTLIAVLIGGKLFGLWGMLFFIPLTAVIYNLVKENTRKKLIEKKLNMN